MTSPEPKKKAVSSSDLLKKLKLEKKRSELLKQKQLKTLKLLKLMKKKLEKYQRAYLRLKKKAAEAAPPAPDSSLQDVLKRSRERLSKTLGLLKESQDKCRRLEAERISQSKKLTTLADSFAQLQKAQSGSNKLDAEAVKKQQQTLDHLEQQLYAAEQAKAESDRTAQEASEQLKSSELHHRRELSRLDQLLQESKAALQHSEETLEQVASRLKTREAEHEEALLKLWDLEERIKNVGSDVSGAMEAKDAEIEELKRRLQKLSDDVAAEESEKEKAQARLNESRDEARVGAWRSLEESTPPPKKRSLA